MNKEIKQKWIDALRSGKYKQARHQLATEDGYCCLGVLCEVVGGGYNASSTHPPVSIAEAAGIGRSPLVVIGGRGCTLTDLNDGATDLGFKNFNEIADIIEQQL